MVERTRKGGGEIVNLLGDVRLVRARRGRGADRRRDHARREAVLPCTALLEGEYGIDDLYMGVPVKLGAGGVEEIVELDLSDQERTWLQESADAVREVVGVLTARRAVDLGLKGRTAIVCGASSGIGLATAEALAEEGANVVMFARRARRARARGRAHRRRRGRRRRPRAGRHRARRRHGSRRVRRNRHPRPEQRRPAARAKAVDDRRRSDVQAGGRAAPASGRAARRAVRSRTCSPATRAGSS